MKKIILFLLLTGVAQLYAQKSAVYMKNGNAIDGYDAVAFFTESKAVKGKPEIAYSWMDAKWLFSTAANKAAFVASPEKYAPQYGGYCAYGTADGHKAPTAADTWTIINKKLYFNYNKDVQAMWNKDQSGLISAADKKWPDIKDKE